MRRPQRGFGLVDLAIVAVVCVIAIVHARVFASAEIDDAFITFRYADHLARGLGPTYNAGEHVEGSSSFFLVVLLAPFLRFGADPLAVARFVSTMAFAGTAALAYLVVASVTGRRARAAASGAALVVAASTPLAFFANSGLETDVYALFLMLTFVLLVREGGTTSVAWAVAGGFTATARPEGAFFFAILFALAGIRLVSIEGTRVAARTLLRASGAFFAVFGPVLAFRLAYYHAWLPNTVLAKSGGSARFHDLDLRAAVTLALAGDGIAQASTYAKHVGYALLFAPLGLLRRRTRFAAASALVIASACVVVSVWSDGDWMGYERLLTPAMAPVAVAIGLGVSALLESIERLLSRTFRVADRWRPALVAAVSAAFFVLPVTGSSYQRTYAYPFVRTARFMGWLGTKLAMNARDDDLLATDMGGRIPYYARIRTIETFGLCDATIATEGTPWPRMGKTDLPYVIGRRPTYYVFNFPSGVADMYRDPAFAGRQGDYMAFLTPGYKRGFGKLLLVRRDRPEFDGLAAALHAEVVDARDELRRLNLL